MGRRLCATLDATVHAAQAVVQAALQLTKREAVDGYLPHVGDDEKALAADVQRISQLHVSSKDQDDLVLRPQPIIGVHRAGSDGLELARRLGEDVPSENREVVGRHRARRDLLRDFLLLFPRFLLSGLGLRRFLLFRCQADTRHGDPDLLKRAQEVGGRRGKTFPSAGGFHSLRGLEPVEIGVR